MCRITPITVIELLQTQYSKTHNLVALQQIRLYTMLSLSFINQFCPLDRNTRFLQEANYACARNERCAFYENRHVKTSQKYACCIAVATTEGGKTLNLFGNQRL